MWTLNDWRRWLTAYDEAIHLVAARAVGMPGGWAELADWGGCTHHPGNHGDVMLGTSGRYILPVEETATVLASLEWSARLARIPAHILAQLKSQMTVDGKCDAAVVMKLVKRFGGWEPQQFFEDARRLAARLVAFNAAEIDRVAAHLFKFGAYGKNPAGQPARPTAALSSSLDVLDAIHRDWTRSVRRAFGIATA
jgi:hypothetical protein